MVIEGEEARDGVITVEEVIVLDEGTRGVGVEERGQDAVEGTVVLDVVRGVLVEMC